MTVNRPTKATITLVRKTLTTPLFKDNIIGLIL
jgi:hypothetical protein